MWLVVNKTVLSSHKYCAVTATDIAVAAAVVAAAVIASQEVEAASLPASRRTDPEFASTGENSGEHSCFLFNGVCRE